MNYMVITPENDNGMTGNGPHAYNFDDVSIMTDGCLRTCMCMCVCVRVCVCACVYVWFLFIYFFVVLLRIMVLRPVVH